MNPTRWHVEEVLRRLELAADYERDCENYQAASGVDMAADIVREVMALEPPLCKCGHPYDAHDEEMDCAWQFINNCPCEKYDPAPKVTQEEARRSQAESLRRVVENNRDAIERMRD